MPHPNSENAFREIIRPPFFGGYHLLGLCTGILCYCVSSQWSKLRMKLSLLGAQQLQISRHSLNPQKEILEVQLLIRRMQIVVRQTEPHHDTWNAQGRVKRTHDRDRPARSDVDRVLPPHLLHRLRCRFDEAIVW